MAKYANWSDSELGWWRRLWGRTAATMAVLTGLMLTLITTGVVPIYTDGQPYAIGGLGALTLLSGSAWTHFDGVLAKRAAEEENDHG